MASNQGSKSGTSNRGFASMDPARQREIASEGGRAAHEKGTAHEFTSEEAREAGRKGGMARSQNRMRAQASGGFGSSSNNSGAGSMGSSSQGNSGSGNQSNMNDQAEE